MTLFATMSIDCPYLAENKRNGNSMVKLEEGINNRMSGEDEDRCSLFFLQVTVGLEILYAVQLRLIL